MEMPHNAFKRAIRDGKSQIGIWSSLSSNYTVEVIAGAGFDWILLDTEHSPNDLESVLQQAQAAAAYPVSTIARVPWNDMVTIKRFLDIGIQTLLIPYVCSVAEAKDAVRLHPISAGRRARRRGLDARDALRTRQGLRQACARGDLRARAGGDEGRARPARGHLRGRRRRRRVHRSGRPARVDGLHRRDQQSGRRADHRGGDAPHPQVRQGAGRARVRRARHSPLHRRRRALHRRRRPTPASSRAAPRRSAPSTRAEIPAAQPGDADAWSLPRAHLRSPWPRAPKRSRSTADCRACISTARASASSTGARASSSIAAIRSTTSPTRSTFEETCYLLLHGELPTRGRARPRSTPSSRRRARFRPEFSTSFARCASAHPMDVLRTAVSALAAFDPDVGDLRPAADASRKGVRLTSQVPMIIAAHEAIRHGREPVAARSEPLARRQLPLHGDRPDAERQRRAADGRRHDPARRARLERLGVHGAGRGRHQGEPARGDHRGDRGAVRSLARRRRGERDPDGAGNRRCRRGPPTT